jgi:hypothetical protein
MTAATAPTAHRPTARSPIRPLRLVGLVAGLLGSAAAVIPAIAHQLSLRKPPVR